MAVNSNPKNHFQTIVSLPHKKIIIITCKHTPTLCRLTITKVRDSKVEQQPAHRKRVFFCHHLSPLVKCNLLRVLSSQQDAFIRVYFSVHISILGHVRLISKTVHAGDTKSAPLSGFHFLNPSSNIIQNRSKTKASRNCENMRLSVQDQYDFFSIRHSPL